MIPIRSVCVERGRKPFYGKLLATERKCCDCTFCDVVVTFPVGKRERGNSQLSCADAEPALDPMRFQIIVCIDIMNLAFSSPQTLVSRRQC